MPATSSIMPRIVATWLANAGVEGGSRGALVVQAPAHVGQRRGTAGQALALLVEQVEGLGRQPCRQRLALCDDAVQVGELLFDPEQLDVGGAQAAAQEGLVGLQLEQALAHLLRRRVGIQLAGLVRQPHAFASGPLDEVAQRVGTWIGRQFGRLVQGHQTDACLQQRYPFVQQGEPGRDFTGTLAQQVQGRLGRCPQLLKQPKADPGRVLLECCRRGRRQRRELGDLGVDLGKLVPKIADPAVRGRQPGPPGIGLEPGLAEGVDRQVGAIHVGLFGAQPLVFARRFLLHAGHAGAQVGIQLLLALDRTGEPGDARVVLRHCRR